MQETLLPKSIKDNIRGCQDRKTGERYRFLRFIDTKERIDAISRMTEESGVKEIIVDYSNGNHADLRFEDHGRTIYLEQGDFLIETKGKHFKAVRENEFFRRFIIVS